MVSVQTSRFHLRLEGRQLLGRGPWLCCSVSKLPPHPSVWGLWLQGRLRPRGLFSIIQVHQSLCFLTSWTFFVCSFLNWYLWHTRAQVPWWTLCTRESSRRRERLSPLVCLLSPARTTGISPGFHLFPTRVGFIRTDSGKWLSLSAHTLTRTLCPETCFFKPTDLHSPISQPSKCRMPLAAGLPNATCFLGRLLCPRSTALPSAALPSLRLSLPAQPGSSEAGLPGHHLCEASWVSAGRLPPFPHCTQLCPKPAVPFHLRKYLVNLISMLERPS